MKLSQNYGNLGRSTGLQLQQQGDFNEAIACYEQLSKAHPYIADGHALAADVYLNRGQFAQVLDSYRAALRITNFAVRRQIVFDVLLTLIYFHCAIIASNRFFQSLMRSSALWRNNSHV